MTTYYFAANVGIEDAN